MDVTLKLLILCVFLFVAAKGESAVDSLDDPKEKWRQFPFVQHRKTRETMKSDKSSQFTNFWEMLVNRLERNQAALFANFSREFNENMGNLYLNLSGKLGSLNETLQRNHQQLSSSVWNLTASLRPSPIKLSTVGKPAELIPTSQPPVQTEVEEVSGNNGTIEFRGEKNLHIRRKMWVLWGEGKSYRNDFRFVMEENNLGEDAHLSLWGSFTYGNSHVWNGSQTDWRTERTTFGPLVLLTLVVKPSANPGPPPSFKLSFTSTNGTTVKDHSGEIFSSDGIQSVSFPHQNAKNYSQQSYFQAVIAPQSGRPFSLTLKYLNVPGTPPGCNYNHLYVYFLEESPTETKYKMLDRSSYSECGRLGNVSELLGATTVAIVRFLSWTSNAGRGFRMEVKPN